MFLTYENQLRSETDPEAIANLERKGWVPAPQPPYDPDTQECVWENGQWVVIPKPPTVYGPAQAYQVRVWMIRNNIPLADVPAIIESNIPAGPEQDEALIRWEYATQIPPDSPLVIIVAQSLGLTIDVVWPEILAIN